MIFNNKIQHNIFINNIYIDRVKYMQYEIQCIRMKLCVGLFIKLKVI